MSGSGVAGSLHDKAEQLAGGRNTKRQYGGVENLHAKEKPASRFSDLHKYI